MGTIRDNIPQQAALASLESQLAPSERGGVTKLYDSIKSILSKSLCGSENKVESPSMQMEVKPHRPDIVIDIPDDNFQAQVPISLLSKAPPIQLEDYCPEVVIDMSNIDCEIPVEPEPEPAPIEDLEPEPELIEDEIPNTEERTSKKRIWDSETLKTVASILDPREIVFPMTARKAAIWATYAGTAALVYQFAIKKIIEEGLDFNSVPVEAVLFGFEPLANIGNLLLSKYSAQPTASVEFSEKQKEMAKEIGLIIPCHNSADVIEKTLNSCLVHFKPEQIFVVDNGDSENPTDATPEIVKNVDRNINYRWSSVGNKTIAQYIGAKAAKDFKYVMTIDDDVSLPEVFNFATDSLDDKKVAMAYSIRASHPDGKPNFLTKLQDLEYKLSDHSKTVESDYATVQFPHGAISLWKNEVFTEILKEHDCVYYADDVKQGLALMDKGYKMGLETSTPVETEAPATVLGASPNLYAQRVRSWDMAKHFYSLKFLKSFCTTKTDTVGGTALLKTHQALNLPTAFEWAKIPFLIYKAGSPDVWAKAVTAELVNTAAITVWNYRKLKDRPELKSDISTIVAFPAYKAMRSLFGTMALGRTLFVTLPNGVKSHSIPSIEEDPDSPINSVKSGDHFGFSE